MVTFDIFSSEWTTELILVFDWEKHRSMESLIFDQMRDLGYETHNSIINLGSLFILSAISILGFAMWALLALVNFISRGYLKTKYQSTLNIKLFWFSSSLFFEAFFEWLIAGFLNFKLSLDSTLGEIISFYLAYSGLFVCLVILPG